MAELTRRELLWAASGAAAGLALVGSRGALAPEEPPRLKTPYRFGLHVKQDDLDDNLRTAERLATRRADIVLLFAKLREPTRENVERLMDAGYDVALTLEWWNGGDRHNPEFSLSAISSGRHDRDYERWLRSFRHLPRPVHLRPLHEFNGDWYPWGVYAPANRVEDFRPAWEHVVGLAREVAGDRVIIQWCCNRRHAGGHHGPIAEFYPGDDLLDELAINGYMRPGRRWKSFEEINGPFYRELKQINPRAPFWIGETACTEQGGDKAAWITDMFDTVLTRMPLDCLTWFHEFLRVRDEPDRDWPFDSSTRALHAFRAGLQRGVHVD